MHYLYSLIGRRLYHSHTKEGREPFPTSVLLV
nr:MAG TPA: hypothetical protein [Caudoviricetes sp.]